MKDIFFFFFGVLTMTTILQYINTTHKHFDPISKIEKRKIMHLFVNHLFECKMLNRLLKSPQPT